MATAKKATKADSHLKVMVWGEPGAGKTRLALSFPSPLLIDLEKGSRLYADQFDFLVAEPAPNLPTHGLVKAIVDEFEQGEYPTVGTLVIDPITDYLDALEAVLIKHEEKNGVNLANLKGPQKAQVYARIKDGIRERLNKLLSLPCHIVFVARAKNQWEQSDGKMQVTGRTADANEIIDYLCDIVIHLQRGGNGVVKKSRLAELPDSIKAVTFGDLDKALKESPANISAAATVRPSRKKDEEAGVA